MPIVFIMQLDFATLETSKNGGSATIAQTFVCATPPTERPYVLASWIFTGRHNLEWLNAYIYWLQARLTYDFFRFLKGPLFLSFMNMQCLEEFINEHTEPDSGHEPNFLYQTLGIILAVVSVVVDRWPL